MLDLKQLPEFIIDASTIRRELSGGKDIIISHPYALRKLWKNLKFSEGSLLNRVIASFALLLGLTFLTLTLFLGNAEAVVKVLQSYVAPFP